jgi:hypothetical protein
MQQKNGLRSSAGPFFYFMWQTPHEALQELGETP